MKPRYIHRRTQQKNYRQIVTRWYTMRAEHLPDIVLFVHRLPWKSRQWVVSEEITGARVGGEWETRQYAVEAAQDKLACITPKKFKAMQQRAQKFMHGPVADLPEYPIV